jgi:hypothetical protein
MLISIPQVGLTYDGSGWQSYFLHGGRCSKGEENGYIYFISRKDIVNRKEPTCLNGSGPVSPTKFTPEIHPKMQTGLDVRQPPGWKVLQFSIRNRIHIPKLVELTKNQPFTGEFLLPP